VSFWLSVGDIADEHGRYEALGAPVYWIHGNNDNFDAIAAGNLPPDLHHIENGTVVDPGLRVAGLGGTFAPTWYETRAADLPHPGGLPSARSPAARPVKDDKRRHFVREEIDACKRLRDVDVLLTHEAPKPFRVFPHGRGPDAGKAQINEVLAVMRPRLHLFGHHHRFSDEIREGARSVGLDLVAHSYLLVEVPALDIRLQTL
jgi:Icc-related predicted phosphoesterase